MGCRSTTHVGIRRGWMHLSIQQKLIGLIAVIVTAIVGFFTIHFPRQHIEDLRAALTGQAQSYGAMFSRQLDSAVAFADRETAREVLSSLDADPDVVSISLFSESGEALFRQGQSSPWIDQARGGVLAPRIVSEVERVSVVAPVVSAEGPRGTLVIELSTAQVQAGLRRVVRMAMAVGAAALLFGIAAAWLISRSVAGRLRAIAGVAASVTSGAAKSRPADDSSTDEIGSLAGAFNRMVDQLQAEQERLRSTVRELTAAEDALARVNRELEDRVEMRTAELTAANHQLLVEMEQRGRMELELRQAQKLESVGRLASGIAHEINTPIQYVSDSCQFLRDASRDIRSVIDDYHQVLTDLRDGAIAPGEAEARAARIDDEADLAYVLENLPLAVDRAIEGVERVATIVRAMKEFAYPERKEMAPADINRAIQTTLMVSRNEYKYVAEVTTDLGDVPHVVCHVGEFNQVILNIVVNAAHAIQDVVGESGARGEIAIRTWAAGADAFISIRDTGTGIPRDIIDKVFDPFFTTKGIGKGTGQGLAIARVVIMEKHGGTLLVESEPGRGTTFTISLPVAGKQAAAAAKIALAG